MLEVTNIVIICLTVITCTILFCGTMLALKGMEITAIKKEKMNQDI